MITQRKTILNKLFPKHIWVIFLVFTALHLFLLNINYAEWGDSYRILRASEFIREGSYPSDEKRAPLYSLILALRPEAVDQVVWGRWEMFALSLAFFIVFYKYLKLFNLGKRFEELALWLLVLNPTFLYWSIRIMADVPFALITLLVFYLYKKWQDNFLWWKYVVLGFLLGLGVLTRFEGYILGFSLGAALFYTHIIKKKKSPNLKNFLVNYVLIFAGFLMVSLPWFLIRNPLYSTYFEEPARRVYNLKTFYIYLVSSMYLFGFTSACYFFAKQFKAAKKFLKENIFITVFIALELFLVLLWPAAVPRLFVPAIPFLAILMAYLIDKQFSGRKTQSGPLSSLFFKNGLILVFLLSFYLISQYILRLQFLVLIKTHLLVVILIQLVNIGSILKNNYKLFKISLIASMLVWSLSTVYLHKDIFKAVVKANKYAQSNLSGRIAYNDVSSVSDWYLNQKSDTDNVKGFYLNMDSREGRSLEVLEENQADYVLITNEHNTNMEFDSKKAKHLEEIKEFSYTIRGERFFTKILEVNYERN